MKNLHEPTNPHSTDTFALKESQAKFQTPLYDKTNFTIERRSVQ